MSAAAVSRDALESRGYLDSSARWQAVLNRDPAADGIFYYGVQSTGIYCRPTCPARRPRPANVSFFASGEDARQAGFRACLRCQPDEVSARQAAVAEIQRLVESADRPPTLSELGRAVGFSPFHLQRVFKQATGLSPKQYATAHRARRLRTDLIGSSTVIEATYEAGFGSSRAAYQAAATELGMSPGAYKKGGHGQRIAYALADSPLGRMLVAATERGVCTVRFGDDEGLVAELRAEFPRALLVQDEDAVEPHVAAVGEHLAGRGPSLDLPLDLVATDFQKRVWAALKEIPYGETRTYAQIAEMIGQPGAARAVGRACALNPVALAVPCHRALGSGGKLTGYRWGLERKRILLNQERARGLTAAVSPDEQD